MLRGGCKAPDRRRHLNDHLSWQQDQALSSNIYLLREMGPTGFLLREEEPENRDFRVFLGNPHLCNCPTFLKGEELCKHICWILLKKFKLSRNHEYALQLGLVEREINDLLLGIHQVQTPKQGRIDQNVHMEEDGCIQQKEIDADDICTICQELLLEKKLPVTFCRFGCGNSIHIKCMKILANYQDMISNTSMLKCPLCRKDFAPLNLVLEEFKNSNKLVVTAEKERLDKHLGIPCNNCKQFPIEGKCYKCTECVEYHLCQECLDSCCHPSHPFKFREKRNQQWKSLEKKSNKIIRYINNKNETEDKTLHSPEVQGQVYTPRYVVKSLPFLLITKQSKLLAPGYQCRLCLKAFRVGQHTRSLPCTHKFHRKCIDKWLLSKSNSCPIDGQVIYNPLIWQEPAVREHARLPVSNTDKSTMAKPEEAELFIPGTGLTLKENRLGALPSLPPCTSKMLSRPEAPPDAAQNMKTDDLNSAKLDDVHSRKSFYEYKIIQHFPRYLQDLPTRTLGKLSPQTLFPFLAQKNVQSPTGMKSLLISEKTPRSQNQMRKGDVHSNLKKSFSSKVREDNRKLNTLPTGDLNLYIKGTTTELNFCNSRHDYIRKIQHKSDHLPRRSIRRPLNTNSTELSLMLKGVQL
ncbi:E3 ubiquitin-protein ligase ZSWIM2 [Erinaceus europaeus]|uniref:RING-type E3 ubiquitin transferase n=1 Tax=Erinaceus europaeus TaxID=9365 RepID=A0A1S3A5B7_ERIEU|nr:E3 ubiquitin-protein ligase ZSWIM2 [Erinaceus europaeus]